MGEGSARGIMGETAQKELDWVETNFERFQSSLNGEKESPFHRVRCAALENFRTLGLPAAGSEDWRYTNLAPLRKQSFSLPARSSVSVSALREQLRPYVIEGLGAHELVFVNGSYCRELSCRAEEQAGFTLRSLAEVLHDACPERAFVESHLAKYASYKEEAFVALNTAFTHDGALIVIKKNTKLDRPLHVIHAMSGDVDSYATYPRILIFAEEGSEAEIVESYLGLGPEKYFTTAVTEVVVKPNANIQHYRIQREAPGAYHYSRVQISQERDSRFSTSSYSFGAALSRNEVQPLLAGSNSWSGLYGLSLLAGEQHVDNFTVLDHMEPNCESHELYKGIYGGSSKGVFNGTIIVRPGAQKTNAIQSNRAILLTDRASSNAKPQLKIWADDVKCTHGATVGRLDDEALFYLRSRGISKQDAGHILLQAFAGEIVSVSRNEALRNYLNAMVLEKLSAEMGE